MNRDRIWQLVDAQSEFLVSTRRRIHQHPELSFKETRTATLIQDELSSVGYEPRTGIGSGGTGSWAVLEGGLPGPTIALRADIDALPVEERNELPFRSQNPGVMHACGHDAHTAILLGVARALKSVQAELPGRVVFLFQHAEEFTPGGALDLIAAGALKDVDAVFGLHQTPREDVGRIVLAPGPRYASADTFHIEVLGRGGHAAFPHRTLDPVHVAAQLVTSLHQIVSRRIDPLEAAVVTVGSLSAGTKANVIADSALLSGTVRAFSQPVREILHREIETVSRGVTGVWGCDLKFEYIWGPPVLTNHAAMSELAARAADLVLGPEAVSRETPAVMGAEDFAYYVKEVPGAFAWLGAGRPGVPALERPLSHSGGLLIEEGCLATGTAWYLSLVTNFEEIRGLPASA